MFCSLSSYVRIVHSLTALDCIPSYQALNSSVFILIFSIIICGVVSSTMASYPTCQHFALSLISQIYQLNIHPLLASELPRIQHCPNMWFFLCSTSWMSYDESLLFLNPSFVECYRIGQGVVCVIFYSFKWLSQHMSFFKEHVLVCKL